MVSTIVSTILHWQARHGVDCFARASESSTLESFDTRDFSIENEMARSPVRNSRHDSGEVSTIESTILSM